ncbi:MAG: bile acid:sodium symporter family protein [Bacteroidales bacterium]|nr:bile acid:sodium symporter family protein [Bacteroidales bacterium]MBO7379535.1 bile acid:sodium symporter family protein [Bacteroidales bacterium]MBP5214641.1 bile acid:sodium symporter family protein [Bacteroidales bacterium]
MLRILQLFSRFMGHYTSVVVILAAVIAAIQPDLFAWISQYKLANIILGLIMLTMGCTLSTDDFRILLHRPLDILLGTLAQFTVMPFVAYGLSRLFHLSPELSVGIILVGCCPGGVSSNIMSFLCKGDVAFSVGMTTVSTLLAPVATPMLVYLLAGAEINVDTWGMFQNILVVTLLPVAVGCLFNYLFGRRQNFRDIQSCMPGISVICLALIVGNAVRAAIPNLQLAGNAFTLLGLTLCVVFCHNTLGYLLGYLIGAVFRFTQAKRRTISIEVGMQNAGLATNLAPQFFDPLAVLPCAISCAYHSISGTILANLFSTYDRLRERNKQTRA